MSRNKLSRSNREAYFQKGKNKFQIDPQNREHARSFLSLMTVRIVLKISKFHEKRLNGSQKKEEEYKGSTQKWTQGTHKLPSLTECQVRKKVLCFCDQGYSNTVPAKFQKKFVFSVRLPPLQNNNFPKRAI